MSAYNTTAVLGRTGIHVSSLCVGSAAWGVESPVHGLIVSERDAIDTVLRAFDGPINFLDTSNNYGDGESERRIGLAIAERGGVPEGFILQTKLDRDPGTGSFDAGRMKRSLEESLSRLGIDSVPILFLHDPENVGYDLAMAENGPVAALAAFRDEGYADYIGISGGPATLLRRFIETDMFDVLITHNRYTLVDRTADALISAAAQRGVGVLNAAIYGGGILASWPRISNKYHYATAAPSLIGRIDAMGAACAEFGIPLIAAALQFSTRDARIASTICGMVSPRQLDETLLYADVAIPEELWRTIDSLCPPDSEWIGD